VQRRDAADVEPGARIHGQAIRVRLTLWRLVKRFFAIGAKVVGSANPVAIFLAGCRECLPEWEIQVAGWPRLRADYDRDPEDSDAEFCPRGQNGRGTEC
jgi:hypothetical protein